MPTPDSPLAKLLDGPMRPGRVTWIGLRVVRRGDIRVVNEATFVAERGIEGDRYTSTHNGARQVTLIQREHLDVIASFLGVDRVAPEDVRRNIVVEGVNLLALKDRRFRIGVAELSWSGDCAPCGHMDEKLGPGGYNAMRGHGGITARILKGGLVRVGDAVERLLD